MITLEKMFAGSLALASKFSIARAQQKNELRSMGERELSDLGIGASEIPFLLHEPSIDTNSRVDAVPVKASIKFSA